MKVVSFYTKNTPYEQVANEFLLPTVKKFNLDYYVEAIEDLGSWDANTSYKSVFLLECLNKFKEPICFLDADAEIIKYPELLYNLPKDFDFAYHLLNWNGHWRNNWDDTSNMHLLSGTLAIGYTDKARAVLNRFKKECPESVGKWEQRVLQDIIESTKELKVTLLPAEYCCVLMTDYSMPKYIKDPIIVHNQCSRKYRYFDR